VIFVVDFCDSKQNNGLNTAIILIAKTKGPFWTYENIIKPTLLPMIINHEYSCIYDGFSLLGMFISYSFYLFSENHEINVLFIFRKTFASISIRK